LSARVPPVLLLSLTLLACGHPTHGPARIAWGRDVCEHCQMVISDKRFAAEIRLAGHVHRFDDPGCAFRWLEAQTGGEAATEIWVMDEDRQEWIDARTALYRPGQRTPMAYGFGAVSKPERGSLDFDAVRQAIREREQSGPRAGG